MQTVHKFTITVTVPLIMSGMAMTAWAADDNAAVNASALSQLYACIDIAQNDARLECQDREIKKLRDATETKRIVVIDEKAAKVIQKKSFGLSLPKLGIPSFGKESDKPKSVLLAVSSINQSGSRLIINMKNGQVWQTVEPYSGRLPKDGNIEAKIKSTLFGSYLMTVSNGEKKSKALRAKRIE